MARLLDEPLGALLDVPAAGPVRPEVAAFVARIATLAFTTASVATPAATARALATNTPETLLGAFAELLTAGGRTGAAAPLAAAFLRGRVALADALARSGGVWRADEAQTQLRVSRTTLLQWREAGRVLAVPLSESFVYPVAQFAPAATDLAPPRPYPAMTEILAVARGRLTPGELAGLLATPQPGLAGADGAPRTGFATIAAGEAARVVAMVRHVTTAPDADADADAPDALAPARDALDPAADAGGPHETAAVSATTATTTAATRRPRRPVRPRHG